MSTLRHRKRLQRFHACGNRGRSRNAASVEINSSLCGESEQEHLSRDTHSTGPRGNIEQVSANRAKDEWTLGLRQQR